MNLEEDNNNSLDEYRELETRLHMELMSVTRRYLSKLRIVSLIGVLDIVKQEIQDLEKATKKNLDIEKHENITKDIEKPDYL